MEIALTLVCLLLLGSLPGAGTNFPETAPPHPSVPTSPDVQGAWPAEVVAAGGHSAVSETPLSEVTLPSK